MTDLETMEAMLKRANIPYNREDHEGYILIEVKRGYHGFVVELAFFPDGRMKDVSAWE